MDASVILGSPIHFMKFSYCLAEDKESGWEIGNLGSSHGFAMSR